MQARGARSLWQLLLLPGACPAPPAEQGHAPACSSSSRPSLHRRARSLPLPAAPGTAPLGRAPVQASGGCSKEQRRTRLTPPVQELLLRLAAGCWPSSASPDSAIGAASHSRCCLRVQQSNTRQPLHTLALYGTSPMRQIYLNRKQRYFALVTSRHQLLGPALGGMRLATSRCVSSLAGKRSQAEATVMVGICKCWPPAHALGPRHARC